MADSRLAIITFVSDADGSIDNSLPSHPVHPWLPAGGSGNRPDNSLPLPVFPFDPTVGIDNTLPTPPPAVVKPWPPRPGDKFIVKYLACKGLILVPDNSLPATGARPDQGLPDTAEPKNY